MEKRIDEALKDAMKSMNSVARDALRNVKEFITNTKTSTSEAVDRIEDKIEDKLDDNQVTDIIQNLIKGGKDSAVKHKENNRVDLHDYEMAQVKELKKVLPNKLTADEAMSEVKKIIDKLGITSKDDVSKVIGVVTKELGGRADLGVITEKVSEILKGLK